MVEFPRAYIRSIASATVGFGIAYASIALSLLQDLPVNAWGALIVGAWLILGGLSLERVVGKLGYLAEAGEDA